MRPTLKSPLAIMRPLSLLVPLTLSIFACTHSATSVEESMELNAGADETNSGKTNQDEEEKTADDRPDEPSPLPPENADFVDSNEYGLGQGTAQAGESAASAKSHSDSELQLSPADAVDPSELMGENGSASSQAQAKVLFGKNSTRLDKKYATALKEIAQQLQADRQLKVLLSAHTDAGGSKKRNKAIAQKRAQAVKRALIKLGVSPSQIKIKNFGENQMLAGRDQAQNRRVELTLQ